MKPILKFAIFVLLAVACFHISCQKELSCENCASGSINNPPVAIAGPDLTILLPTDSMMLDGSASHDPDGTIRSFQWIKISGPASFNILNTDSSKTNVRSLQMGVYKFELKVTDNGGLSAKDTIQVIVIDPAINQPPVANAGSDQTIILPADSALLNGTLSMDPDGTIVSYQWSKISGPTVFTIINYQLVQTAATNLVQGVYQFELKVTDNGGLFSKDTLQVNVSAANNIPPVAIAGNDTLIISNQTSCTPVPITITLNGSLSFDPDGTILSYLWSGPNGIANPAAATTTVSGLLPGSYGFVLKVTDNNGAITQDTFWVSIIPANRPIVPAQLITVTEMPEARGATMAIAGNKILFAGGGNDNPTLGCTSAKVDIYDLTSGLWTTALLSQARTGMGVAVSGNKIFFAGGYLPRIFPNTTTCYITNSADTRSATIDIYDASANTWSVAQLSTGRQPIGASAGNKVVFAGGDDDICVANADIYDGASGIWSTSQLSEGRHISQSSVAGNNIIFAGGCCGLYGASGGNLSRQIDTYNASLNTWTTGLLNDVRGEMGIISANNKLYLAGGWVDDPASTDWMTTNTVEIRDLITNTSTFDCLSEPKAGLTAVRKDNKIIFIGGYFYGSSNTRFDIYDLTTNSWSIGVLPQTIPGATIISYNNSIYIAGVNFNGVLSNKVWKLVF